MEGWRGRAGPPPSHFSPPSCCTCEQPGCGIFTLLPWQQTVMSQTQGPGLPPPRGVSGGSVASDWGGPRLWGRASGPGRILAPLLRAIECWSPSAPARTAPPPPEDRRLLELPELAFYFGHSILLPENSTRLSSAERRCSLAVPFFKSDLLAGGLALAAVSDLAVCPSG